MLGGIGSRLLTNPKAGTENTDWWDELQAADLAIGEAWAALRDAVLARSELQCRTSEAQRVAAVAKRLSNLGANYENTLTIGTPHAQYCGRWPALVGPFTLAWEAWIPDAVAAISAVEDDPC